MSPFLWIGITFAILRKFGNTPWLKDIFIISLMGFKNSFLNGFKILVGKLFGPLALIVFIKRIRSSTSSGTVKERKTVFLFSGPRYERWVFFPLTMFLFFSAILVKKLLKWLEIYLALVINWLSVRRLEINSSDLFLMFIIPFMVFHTTFRLFLLSLKYCL